MNKIYFILAIICLPGNLIAQDVNYHPFSASLTCNNDSLKTTKSEPLRSSNRMNSLIIPAGLITLGALVESFPENTHLSKEKIQVFVHDRIAINKTSIDDYLQFAPLATLYTLKFSGLKGRNDFINQVILTAKSELIMTAMVYSMKNIIHDSRPDGSDSQSMPSGHTAQAFVSAALLDMEYGETLPWISVTGYLAATATAWLRVSNNRHWSSDVLVGAGIGLLSVKLAYLTHQYRWGRKYSGIVIPTFSTNRLGLAYVKNF